ncbi:MAG TPA: hypothetical protein VFV51_19630 [Vicinamibacterales bacterium]|nr:hypothetical protein [Vicinamibacterales bacterium]
MGENDLAAALAATKDVPDTWKEQHRSVQCQSCRAVMVYDAVRVGQNCEFCGSPALLAYQEIKSPISPKGVLPFKIDRNRVRDDIRRWWRSKWLAPNKLAKSALVDTVHSVYIPYWTFDARAHCPWDAEAGHYYYVTVEGRDSKGNRVVRQERRVRWEPASGVVEHTFDDELVPGTMGVDSSLLRQVEPFPTAECVPYDTAFLSGHVVEHYQVALTEAAGSSEEQMRAVLRELCAAQVPGDTHRNLQIYPTFSNKTFKHLLVPIWLLVYTFGRNPYQVVVNGYTGRMAGKYPKSPWKILFLIVLLVMAFIIFGMMDEG